MGFGYGLSALVALAIGVMIYTYVDFLEQSKTHYTTLGVAQTATSAEIRAAYRRMSLLHHPDKKSQRQERGGSGSGSGSAAEETPRSRQEEDNQAFYDVVEAYEVLSDEGRRSEYDQELFERAQHREEMRNRYRDQSRRPPRGGHAHRSGNGLQDFSLSWHLLHLLPMAHPSLKYWASHLMSYITCVVKAVVCAVLKPVELRDFLTLCSVCVHVSLMQRVRNFFLGLFILGVVGAILDFVVVQLLGCARRFASRLRRRRQLRDPKFVAKQGKLNK